MSASSDSFSEQDTFDYVIIGAGSAGCAVASRLSEDGSRVALLEAGPADSNPLIHIPAGVRSLLHHPKLNWNFASEPEQSSGNRAIHWPRGRVLGGSSSINGMLYVRGNPADYDTWAQMGCRGWSFEEVLPFFKASERYDGGDASIRGRSGPLRVEDYRTILPLTHHFVSAAQEAGFAFNPDLNGSTQDGVGYSQMTRLGRYRGSTARTYLARAIHRENLLVETNALTTGLIMQGARCTGVSFTQDGRPRRFRARREVVLSGGAIGSPHILQLSGIGPAEHLKSVGINPVLDLPGVGANLQDHYVARIIHRVRNEISINELARGLRLAREVLRYFATGKGALTFGITTAQVFCHSREGLIGPDIQLLFTPASYDANRMLALERKPGLTLVVCPVRPSSRGTIMAVSPDPHQYPRISPNYFSHPDDLRVLSAGFKHARRILSSPSIARYSEGEIQPGPQVESDQSLADYARDFGTTIYHPVGTCKMGEDPMAVVDSRLRVRGITGLRVADASIMPVLTTGNTNAPTIMIGEKAAAMILADAKT